MIRKLSGERPVFVLDTDSTTYAFSVMETGQLEHLYYGAKITVEKPEDLVALTEKRAFQQGNSIAYDQEHLSFTLEDVCLEMSGYGKGDIREPFIEIIAADGSATTDFVYASDEIKKGKEALKDLPSSHDDTGSVEGLHVTLKDNNHGYELVLSYYVFEKENVITKTARFVNATAERVILTRLMSNQLDLNEAGLTISCFRGAWIKEMQMTDTVLKAGKFVNSSFTGSSSNRANPFIMVSRPGTTEYQGDCFGFNLVYSGNHYEAAEVNAYDKTRIVSGINPTQFRFIINPGEEFQAPEAVLTFSREGHNGMSQNMHAFVNEHIVAGEWSKKARPVLLNSWEANYFDINEGKLVALAKKGKEAGVELFVMDDGWFGQRSDDKRALGDWYVNTKKLPHGVKGLAEKINAIGLDFGIWIEPEMVNVDSDLYRNHPEWSIEIPGKRHSEGRNQRILDFANPQVVDHMIESMKNVISSGNIAYVKWDMNRIFSDVYSQSLDAEHQGEVFHRYILGFYRLARTLTEAFPKVLFEGCASGGNRFDLGALCYFPQIWASDDTDAVARLAIQNGYSYGYPMSTVSAHVSNVPNHQTLRKTKIDTRFAVAAFGVLGYECNLSDMKKEDLSAIKEQITLYKRFRETMQYGAFYRKRYDNVVEWSVVSKDQKQAVCMVFQKQVHPNSQFLSVHPVGLDPKKKYRFYGRESALDIRTFGDLINAAVPIHVKQGSLLHNVISKFVQPKGDNEDYTAYGDALMNGGIGLKPAFSSTGFDMDGSVRVMGDFEARMYFMEEV
ncbi:MAG: alpha-galactosidase [Lachnospiraceae bacterium]|nr:alpha-galactosidase [Lachnospiraceae bacterium]